MKKKILIALLILSARQFVFAQQVIIENPQRFSTRTDLYFNDRVSVDAEPVAKFEFLFNRSNKMVLELENLQQVDSLPNLDSLLNIVWNDLQNFNDSLQDPLASMRIDYTPGIDKNWIRLRLYPQAGSVYQSRNGEITQLKVEQDTLSIHLSTRRFEKYKGRPGFMSSDPYKITLLLNNINELPSLLDSVLLPKAIVILKNDIGKNREFLNKHVPAIYRGYYSVPNEKIWQSIRQTTGQSKLSFTGPVVQVGVQFINGYWSPSLGAGFELVKRTSENKASYKQTNENHFQLLWEPYFFFQSDSVKSFRVIRNDFITFRYHNSSKHINDNRTILFSQTASFGYLIGRKGDYFGPTTFKFSLPGLKTKGILLEPEFVFNEFFKNFSPSLKLLYFFGED